MDRYGDHRHSNHPWKKGVMSYARTVCVRPAKDRPALVVTRLVTCPPIPGQVLVAEPVRSTRTAGCRCRGSRMSLPRQQRQEDGGL